VSLPGSYRLLAPLREKEKKEESLPSTIRAQALSLDTRKGKKKKGKKKGKGAMICQSERADRVSGRNKKNKPCRIASTARGPERRRGKKKKRKEERSPLLSAGSRRVREKKGAIRFDQRGCRPFRSVNEENFRYHQPQCRQKGAWEGPRGRPSFFCGL